MWLSEAGTIIEELRRKAFVAECDLGADVGTKEQVVLLADAIEIIRNRRAVLE